jgi:hypothetical protein
MMGRSGNLWHSSRELEGEIGIVVQVEDGLGPVIRIEHRP